MISIDAYRVTIGAFNNSSRQLNLRTICRGLTIGCHISSTGISKLLKPTRFVTLFILIAILINCGDIETNPGPTFSIKTVHGSCHQANPKFGPTAGTQCMCNSLASLCYFKIKPLRFWTTSDIDIILDYGNAAYSRLGFVNEYLSFDDIPSTFSMRDHVVGLDKSQRISGYLNSDSTNFIQFVPPFSSGLFVAGGFSTCFMFQNNNVYIFDPHSRDNQGLFLQTEHQFC